MTASGRRLEGAQPGEEGIDQVAEARSGGGTTAEAPETTPPGTGSRGRTGSVYWAMTTGPPLKDLVGVQKDGAWAALRAPGTQLGTEGMLAPPVMMPH